MIEIIDVDKSSSKDEQIRTAMLNGIKSLTEIFSSSLWKKAIPVLTMMFGERERHDLDVSEYVNREIECIFRICRIFGDNIPYEELEKIFAPVICMEYYEFASNDIAIGTYMDRDTYDAFNVFLNSLTKEEIENLRPEYENFKSILGFVPKTASDETDEINSN